MSRLFTSESVADGHPDTICNLIADHLLDRCLENDRESRVAIEVAIKDHTVFVFGELTSNYQPNIEEAVRKVLRGIGYDDPRWGLDLKNLNIITQISQQSSEISNGVTQNGTNLGAGDQGIMFGYAVKETHTFMPLPIYLAHRIMIVHKNYRVDIRERNKPSSIGPDAKSQVTIRYDSDTGKPIEIDTMVLSTLHDPSMKREVLEEVATSLFKQAIKEYPELWTSNTKLLINPAGPFTIGGPKADSGLTGRKIIADSYGGAARHGGGSFSGKDATKVDRSGAYATRWLAKNICANLDRHRTEIQVSYAIGKPEPVSLHIYGMTEDETQEVLKAFPIDFSPASIIDYFKLKDFHQYESTSKFGHFGGYSYPWEQLIRI
jgi:S-adenosylmethionine synthetase